MSYPRNDAPSYERQPCNQDGCSRMEELANGRRAGGLCAAHRWRKKNKRALDPPIDESRSPLVRRTKYVHWRLLVDAAIALGDADGDTQFQRALKTLRNRVTKYGLAVSRKPRAPSKPSR